MAQEAPVPAGETPAAETPKDDSTDNTAQRSESEPKAFDADYVKSLRSENAQWRIKAQQAEERAQEFEDSQKTELEKAQSKAAKLEQAAKDYESKLLRLEVATEKGLPKELIPRLQGSTPEELAADADELLALVKSRTENETPPDFDGGVREPAESTDPAVAHNRKIAELIFGSPRT
jgi:hypothetical protein